MVKGGRQRIKLDDDRFIGNVGWRQLEQTYDSVLLTHNNQQIFGLTINAGYIGNVKTFTGTNNGVRAPLLNVSYKVGDYGTAVGYGYWVDYTDVGTYAKSGQTYGFRMSNYLKPGDGLPITDKISLVYTAEYSNQQNYGHSPVAFDVDRYNVMGGLTLFNFTLQGSMEQLGGKGINRTFNTPLGTNAAFQGWANLFITTPPNGIRDVFGTAIGQFNQGNTVATLAYHDFSDDTSNIHYGKEFDATVLQKFGKHYSVLARYAYYDADKFGTDTQKIWLQGNISF